MEPVIDMAATGRNIKNHMERRGYTVKMVQEYLGLACPQPVYRWLKGNTLPTVEHLYRLSRLLGVPMEELLSNGRAATERGSGLFTSRKRRMRAYWDGARKMTA